MLMKPNSRIHLRNSICIVANARLTSGIFFFVIIILSLLFYKTLDAADAANVLTVPDGGWRLWPDTNAEWKTDTIYLPGQFDLSQLPVHPPTDGWDVLNNKTGLSVTLPGTVEEYFWGKFGLRHYQNNEYYYAKKGDQQVMNGNYLGVSWWWRDVVVPGSFAHKIVLLHIRGARQRAEVFVNHQLVGYDIIAETSFACDITRAIRPGHTNQIAIRITNPGGRLDWLDTWTLKWGQARFQESHGFGGLDRDLTITAEDPVYLDDTWVLNTPQVRTVTAHATVRNTTDREQNGELRFSVVDPQNHSVLASAAVPVHIPAATNVDFQAALSCAAARLWDLNSPQLYEMKAQLAIPGPPGMRDETTRAFGFRWFEPRGIGEHAGLYLNGRRIRLYTAISWGYWGFNGLWPTPALAEKEVRDAKELGLNMLNFHRDIGKEEVLAEQDKLGLLRYMEPGGGITAAGKTVAKFSPSPKGPLDTSGLGGDADSFTQKYEEIKIIRMIRQFRSHPSLVIYVIQNEWDPDLSEPRIFNLLRRMHALDPSRVIVSKSGVSPLHQAWFAPYGNNPRCDNGTGFSGWHDEHTVGGPGVWQDEMYQNPTNFTHRIVDPGEIVDWGEMLGAAVADNHPLMVRQILAQGGHSYDLADHEQLARVYDHFLDRWDFRQAFPTDQQFYTDLGDKCYGFWGKVLETVRLGEDNDILSISGWESTAIENHSGLVDNLRNFKGDPELIAAKLAPLLPVVKPRRLTARLGDQPVLDLYLINETGHAAAGHLQLSVTDPTGQTTQLGSFAAPAYQANRFVYPVASGRKAPAFTLPGKYTFSFVLSGTTPAHNSETVLVVNPLPEKMPEARVGVVGDILPFEKQWPVGSSVKVEPYRDGINYDMAIVALEPAGYVTRANLGTNVLNTDTPELYQTAMEGNNPSVLRFHFDSLPPGPVKVSLYFCEIGGLEKSQRVFDVLANGRTVLTNLDIVAEAGPGRALVKTFTVEASQGIVDICPGRVPRYPALFNAIKLEAGGKTVAILCGGKKFTDRRGLTWEPYRAQDTLSSGLLQKVKAGLPLLVQASDSGSADKAARQFAADGAFQYFGKIPSARASWMGNWVFIRQHPLYAGLPVDEVMNGDYQIPVSCCYGLQVDGPGVQIVAGYGRDHDRDVGAATFTARLGRGELVFQCLSGMCPVFEERLLNNALIYLLTSKSNP